MQVVRLAVRAIQRLVLAPEINVIDPRVGGAQHSRRQIEKGFGERDAFEVLAGHDHVVGDHGTVRVKPQVMSIPKARQDDAWIDRAAFTECKDQAVVDGIVPIARKYRMGTEIQGGRHLCGEECCACGYGQGLFFASPPIGAAAASVSDSRNNAVLIAAAAENRRREVSR